MDDPKITEHANTLRKKLQEEQIADYRRICSSVAELSDLRFAFRCKIQDGLGGYRGVFTPAPAHMLNRMGTLVAELDELLRATEQRLERAGIDYGIGV